MASPFSEPASRGGPKATGVRRTLALHELTLARLPGLRSLEIVGGAIHLVPELGAMGPMIHHAIHRFNRHLQSGLPGDDAIGGTKATGGDDGE